MQVTMRDLEFNRATLPLRAELYFAGVTCALFTNAAEVMTSLSRWMYRGEPGGRTIELEVLVDPAAKRIPDASAHFRALHHLVFAVFSPDEKFVFDLIRRRCSGVVSLETAGDERFWTTRMVPLLLGLMGITVGAFPLHCACVERAGDGILIAGRSQAGKSTLAVSLSRRGLALISDGWTYFTMDSDGDLTAHGISAPVKLLPDAVALFPELQAYQPAKAFNGELAIEVDAAHVLNASVRTHATPRSIVIVERTAESGSRITPIDEKSVQNFFISSVELLPPPLEKLAEARAELIAALSRIERWKLHYGGSPDAAAEMIQRVCGRRRYANHESCVVP